MKRLPTQYIISGLVLILLLYIPLKVWGAVPQYVDTPNKDYNADAPWRVQNADTTIPFSVLIKDVWKNDLEKLSFVQIVTLHYPGPQEADTVYYHFFEDMKLQCARPANPISDTQGCINGNWELNIDKFESTGDAILDGKPITPGGLGYQARDDIYFKVRIVGQDDLGIGIDFSKYLKVHVGEPLAKPGPDWYYGDTHFHTEYTNDLKEYGGQLTAVKDAANAIGLDFLTTTDHASDLEDGALGWLGWFGCWDLCQASWNNLRDRINNLNDSNGLPFIQGEEITCQAIDGKEENGIHLLVYNNSEFISGEIDTTNHPQYSLKSRLDILNPSALAYAAHPMDAFDIILGLAGGIAKWTDQNYQTALGDSQFIGLEIWNTRETQKAGPALELNRYINPFDGNGNWPNYVDNWDAELVEGIEKWDALMRDNLDPLRKIFISGGSDAHGDLNYVTGGIGPLIDLNDNAMGKVRTLVYASGGKNRENILNGLKNGRSVVTDGPVVIFGMDRDQDGRLEGNGSDVMIGDHIVLPQTDETTFFIQWNSTNEFGDINEIAVFYGNRLQTWELAKLYPLDGKKGSLTWSQNASMVPGTYYYRVEARGKDKHGNIAYRCYTNPIWITYEETNTCLASVAQNHWKGEYFGNKDLSGTPLMVRDDGNGFLNFDWANGSPSASCGLNADNFSARWTRSVYFDGGTYRFTITSDDGFSLFVDGVEKLTKWIIQGPTTYAVDVALSVGDHAIKLEYFENGGYATAKLSWQQISPPSCIKTVSLQNWEGEYFGNKNLSGVPLMVRDDGDGFLNFDWAYGSPGSTCGLGTDSFSARWTKSIYFDGGTYRFTITSDDGFRLYIDGALKLEKWFDQGPTTYTVGVPLTAGDHQIVFAYYENGGYATAKLSWEETANCKETVPVGHWNGEYFGNKDMSGTPLMVRDDGTGFLNFDWAYGSPSTSCGLNAENFSARWTRNIYFDGGTYRFTITSDDGFRLFVDGVEKLTKWIIQGPTTYTVDVEFTAGNHGIKLEYFENGGYATAKLSWEQISQTNCIVTVPSDHWKGEYFNNKDLSGSPSMVQDDGNGFLNFDWVYEGPTDTCGIGTDNFSARWTRSVYFGGGTYRFTITSDDGFSLFVDGVEKLTKWIIQGPTTYTVDMALSGGYHGIKLEYFENGGYATAKLSWAKVSLSDGWAYPVGDPNSGAGWQVTNPLGNSWYSEQEQRWYRGHLGEDWFKDNGSSLGEPVYAAAAGEVITVRQNCGNYVDIVIIEHQVEGFDEPIYSFYGHIEADGFVHKGDWVGRRQQIGWLGDPVTFEPHLHFEIKNRTALTNPPFSNCSDIPNGIYISAGYSGISDDYDGGDYYDPSDGISGNRYYHPSRFIENHKEGGVPPGTDCSKFVADLNYPDGTEVSPGQTINKGWRLSNCGDTSWSTAGGYRAMRISGSYGPTSFNIPTVGPGQAGDLYANITVPTAAGTHRATYKLEGPGGTFGDPFWVEAVVQQGAIEYILDDGDPGFVLFGPSQYWHKESIGYGGDMYWTYVNGNVVSNKAQWRPKLAGAGNYQVKVFIPNNYATAGSAKYSIKANGSTYTATVNQNNYYDQWVVLGTYYFSASNNGSEYVELTDATGESGSTYKKIGFDAVKWVRQ